MEEYQRSGLEEMKNILWTENKFESEVQPGLGFCYLYKQI